MTRIKPCQEEIYLAVGNSILAVICHLKGGQIAVLIEFLMGVRYVDWSTEIKVYNAEDEQSVVLQNVSHGGDGSAEI